MIPRSLILGSCWAAMFLCTLASGASAEENKGEEKKGEEKTGDKLKVLIVDGRNNHGPGAGQWPRHEFLEVIRHTEHPITQGLPRVWMHAKDELYQGQRGPARDMTILATAYAAKDKSGTGSHEPMLWVIPYGKG